MSFINLQYSVVCSWTYGHCSKSIRITSVGEGGNGSKEEEESSNTMKQYFGNEGNGLNEEESLSRPRKFAA